MAQGDFSPHEIFVIAKEMEQEGLAFYKAVAKAVSDPDVKAMFLKLASDEVQHVRDIERIEGHADQYFPSEDDSLVAQYVEGLVDTKVFPPLSQVPEIAADAEGVVKAIDFGIGAEKRSIDFYAKTAAKAESADAIETLKRLRAEEERHLELLTELRRNYA
jgi:rubrerythrin